MEPSLLDYARFHEIASDYTAIDPNSYFDSTFSINPEFETDLQIRHLDFKDCICNARATLKKELRREKLKISKKSARYLTSVVDELQAKDLEISWHDLLPDFRRIEDTKIEPPIFRMECESDVALSKRPLRYTPLDIDWRQSTDSYEPLDVPNPFPELRSSESSLIKQVRNEKLRCSKESFSLIESIRSDAGSSSGGQVSDLGRLLEYNGQNEPASPDLLPLGVEDFPPHPPTPTPTPIPSERMLPSPTSSNPMQLDLYCRQPTPRGPTQGDSGSNSFEDLLNSAELVREKRDPRLTSTDYKAPPDNPCTAIISSSKVDTEEKGSVNDTALRKIRFSPDKAPKRLQDREKRIAQSACSTIPGGGANNGISATTEIMLPLSEDIDFAAEQNAGIIHSSKEQSAVGSKKKASQEAFLPTCTQGTDVPRFETLSKDTNTTMTRRQSLQRRPSWNLSSEQLQGAIGVEHTPLPHHPLRVNLGSLSSFMETRGKGTKRQVLAQSHYFASKDDEGSKQFKNDTNPGAPVLQQKPDIPNAKLPQPALSLAIQVPRVPSHHEGLVFLLSTALLKTHLRLTQNLEGPTHPSCLIYRDYPNSSPTSQSRPQHNSSTLQHQYQKSPQMYPPNEADIILSPNTGIILTTSQATMQVYLPGHKSTSLQVNITLKPNTINSPLREQIYNLSPRYEHLYILITHGPDNSTKKRLITADKRIITSLTALTAFCTSISDSGNIIPLLLPSNPDSIATWILALAHKHVCRLPPPMSQSQFRSAFTPVNPKSRVAFELGNMEESIWELFLRRVGLNPFAAQVVLAVLRREECDMDNKIGTGDYDSRVQGESPGCLSRFVEMSSNERRMLFKGLLGEEILKRVDSLIERDWQCDWALNFDDTV